MEFPKPLLIPYIVINVVGLALIPLALNVPKFARVVFVFLFLAVAGFLLGYVLTIPDKLVAFYEPIVLDGVDVFIVGTFAEHTSKFILGSAAYLILAAAFLAYQAPWVRVGVVMGIFAFLGLMPLGIGSFFPLPLFGSVALLFTLATTYKKPIWFVPPKKVRQRKRSRA